MPNCPSKYESIQQQYPLCYSKLQQNQITLNVCPTFYKIQGFTRCMKRLVYFARRTTKLRKALGLKALKKRDNEMHLTKLENLPSSIFHFHSVQLLGRIIPRQICKIEQIQKCQNGWFQFQLNHIFRSFPACIFKSTFPLFVKVQLCLLIHEGLF